MTLDPLHQLWTRTQPRVERAIRNAHDFQDGYRTGSNGPAGTSDRTGTIAARHLETGDPHGDMHRQLAQTINRLADLVDKLAPNQAKADHTATLVDGPAGCRSCARIHSWEPIHRNGLCQHCLRLVPRVDALYRWDQDMPPVDLVRWHRDTGKNITDQAIHRALHGHPRRT